MPRLSSGRHRKKATIGLAALLGASGITAAVIAMSGPASNAAEAPKENCAGLDQALQNNLNFIAGQQANPDAGSVGRIANRQAVVNLIQQRRQAAGCTANVQAGGQQAAQGAQGGSGENCAGLDQALQNNLNFIAGQQAKPDAQSAARIANRQAVVNNIQQRRQAAGCNGNVQANNGAAAQNNQGAAANQNQGNANANQGAAGNQGADNAASGQQVCNGQQVTLSGEGGAPAASSNQFPNGTKLKVTNLDNNQSITVPVTSVSGSCVLLNSTAFNQIHEQGKNLIRRAKIEKVG